MDVDESGLSGLRVHSALRVRRGLRREEGDKTTFLILRGDDAADE